MTHPWITATGAASIASLVLAATATAAPAATAPDATPPAAATSAAAADDAIPSTWAGWTAVGPFGAPAPGRLATSGTRTVVVGTAQDGTAPLLVRDATGVRRVGVVPVIDTNSLLHLEILGEDRYRLVRDCDVLEGSVVGTESTDGGATWSDLPKATCVPSAARILGVRASTPVTETVDGQSVSRGGLERSDDGGATWTAVEVPGPPAEPGGAPVPTQRIVGGVGSITGRGPGNVVAAVSGAVISSTDGGRTFARKDLPPVPGIADPSKVFPRIVACDPTDGCLVEVLVPAPAGQPSRRVTLRFDGTTFGPSLPAAPQLTLARGGGALLGLDQQTGLVRSTDFGTTYETNQPPSAGSGGTVGSHGLLAQPSPAGLRLARTSDEELTRRTVPLPDGELVQVAGTPEDPYALLRTGRIVRYVGSAWTAVADASAVSPASLTLGADGPIVVGRRGVARVVGGAVQLSDSPALAGRALTAVSARGRLAFAWSKNVLVRSTDAGRTWATVRLPESPVTDVQVLGDRAAVALTGDGLLRTSDGGKRFTRGAALPPVEVLDAYGNTPPASLEFTTTKRGTILTRSSAFRTGDGGATAALVPTPDHRRPVALLPYRDGVQLQDPRVDFLLRDGTLLKESKPSLTLRRVGSVKRRTVGRGKARTVRRTATLVGRLKGARVGSSVSIVSVGTAGRYVDIEAVPTINADGTFRTSVTLAGTSRPAVKAIYGGDATPTRTTRSATSGRLVIR